VSGAVAPFIGVALIEKYDSTLPVSLYCLALVIPALIAAFLAPETRHTDLNDS